MEPPNPMRIFTLKTQDSRGDMENDSVYYVDDDQQLIEQRCPSCGCLIGTEVEHHGKTLLQVGDLELTRLHGWHDCPATGQREQIHWDSADVILRRIIKRRKKRL